MGLKSGLVANSCVKMTPHALWHSCVLMLRSFTTTARLILALSSWNMPEPSGKKKWIDGITWSFRNSADWQCLTEATPDHNPTICIFKLKTKIFEFLFFFFFLDGHCTLPLNFRAPSCLGHMVSQVFVIAQVCFIASSMHFPLVFRSIWGNLLLFICSRPKVVKNKSRRSLYETEKQKNKMISDIGQVLSLPN